MPPASATFIAADLPMPDDAPVTSTTLPLTSFSSEALPWRRRPKRTTSSGIWCSSI